MKEYRGLPEVEQHWTGPTEKEEERQKRPKMQLL